MTYTHTRPIVPHSRPSVITMYEGEGKARRAVGSIRPGSWGPMAKECKLIEAYKAGNRPCGPYTVDHIPSNNPDYPDGIWKIFRRDQFMRYADRDDINTILKLVTRQADGELDEFVTLPRIHVGSSTGWYEGLSDDDLDDAFAPVTPKPAHTEDDLDEAFGGVVPARPAPVTHRITKPVPKRENSLHGWNEVIQRTGHEQRDEEGDDPFGVFEVEDEGLADAFDPPDDLDEAFS